MGIFVCKRSCLGLMPYFLGYISCTIITGSCCGITYLAIQHHLQTCAVIIGTTYRSYLCLGFCTFCLAENLDGVGIAHEVHCCRAVAEEILEEI